MSGTYKSINSLGGDSGGGGGGSGTPSYTETFVIADWQLVSGSYQIVIPESSHEKGLNPIVQVFELNGSNYEQVDLFTRISASGNVTLVVGDDSRFNGIVIIGD